MIEEKNFHHNKKLSQQFAYVHVTCLASKVHPGLVQFVLYHYGKVVALVSGNQYDAEKCLELIF